MSEPNRDKLKEKQEMASLSSQLGTFAVGEIGKRMEWKEGSWQKTALHAAVGAASAKLGGQSNATVAVSALSPFANQGIKRLTTDNNGETNLIPNILTHAALGALEAKATGNNVTAGAIAGGGGELLAHGIAKAYYGVDGTTKTVADLTEGEKNNIKTISQLGGAVAGGLIGDSTQSAVNAGDIAKRAVENNLLSKQEDKILYDLSEEFHKKDALSQGKQDISAALLSKDSEIDRLIYLNQTAPQQLTDGQKAYLDRELRAIAASYNIPVENLYNVDFSKTMKRDDSALKTYLNSQNALQNSYDMKQAKSLKEGLEAATLIQGELATPKVLNEAAKTASVINSSISQSTKLTLGVSATGSVGSQLLTKDEIDPKILGLDLTTAYITKGKGFKTTIVTNIASGALNSYLTDDSILNGAISSGISSAIGYGAGKLVEVPLNNKLNPNWRGYVTKPLSDKFTYIGVYRESVVPSVSGNLVGEISNRTYQYIELHKVQSKDNEN